MQKFMLTKKRIFSLALVICLVLALVPILETTASAAGSVLNLTNPPAAGGAWLRPAGEVVYTGAGPLTIRGSNNNLAVRVTQATRVYIDNGTYIRSATQNALSVPGGTTITGRGSNITITSAATGHSAIDARGALTINGTLGTIRSTYNGIFSTTSITINGTIANIFANNAVRGNGIRVLGAVNNISLSGSQPTGFWSQGASISITGRIGNVTGANWAYLVSGDGDIRLTGTIGDFHSVGYVAFAQGAGDIFIETFLTVSSTTRIFNKQPIINLASYMAIWSNFSDGRQAFTGPSYTWNGEHRYIFILPAGMAPPPNAHTGWALSGSHWVYFRSAVRVTGWQSIDGLWYNFTDAGYMRTGWFYYDGNWYFFADSGEAVTGGWVFTGGAWYYMNPDGIMATGWVFYEGVWYYLRGCGAMATGWVFYEGEWYYLRGCGAMATGWVLTGGLWYYLQPSGIMARGTLVINGVQHNFDYSGGWWLG